MGYAAAARAKGDEAHAEQVLAYADAKARYDGMIHRAQDDLDSLLEESNATIDHRRHADDGMIHPATMKSQDRKVYVLSGQVRMFDDGTGVDSGNSSRDIIVIDAATGRMEFTTPDQIQDAEAPVDPEAEKARAGEDIRRSFVMQRASAIDGTLAFAAGESLRLNDEDGREHLVQVVQDNGDGSVSVVMDGGPEPVAMDKERLQQMADLTRRSRLAQARPEEERAADGGESLRAPGEEEADSPQNQHTRQNNAESQMNLPHNETDIQGPSAFSRIPKGEDGEPLLEQTDPKTAWDGVVEYMEDVGDAQEYVESMVAGLTKDVESAKKAVGKVKPSADMAKFKADKAAARQVQAAAEARLEKWVQISNVNKARRQAERSRVNAERAEADRIAHEKAVAQLAEQKRIEAEKKAEQEAVGTHAVNPKIKQKWEAAPKVVGSADVITLPDGSRLHGHYVLTEAGAATASHDVNNAYKPTEGFPIDENGQSVNDRDYERDEDARNISRSIADNYDSRALQSVTVVDNNGVTLSGNGRNIAGELAARQGTDGAYIDYLREFPQKYGLTAEQVQSMQHPRVHFVPDNTFANIVRSLAQYDRLSDFYANEKDANDAVMQLVKAGVVNDKQLPELRTGEALSAAGRELLENTLIGKVFQSNPDAVRQIIAQPGIKQAVVMALSEIAHNRTLANGYDLGDELSKAVDLVARAKQADPDTYKEGVPVSPFGRQQGLFDDELGDSRVTDATTLLLADILNSTRSGDLRKVLAMYNAEAEPVANGQLDIFSGDLRSKEEILKDINQHFINATPKEQQALVDAAIEERKRRAAESAAAEQSGRDGATEQTAPVETGGGQTRREEAKGGRPTDTGEASEGKGDLAQAGEVRLSDEIDEDGSPFVKASSGSTVFGEIREESGLAPAPIKLSLGNSKYGLVHLEKRHGDQIRGAGFTSVEEFVEFVCKNYKQIKLGENHLGEHNGTYLIQIEDDHNNTLYIELSSDDKYWGVNSGGVFRRGYGSNKKEVWSASEVQNEQSAADSTLREEEKSDTPTPPNGNVPTTSASKDSKQSDTTQGKSEKNVPSARKEGERVLDHAARVAEERARQGRQSRGGQGRHPSHRGPERGRQLP